MLVSLKHPSNNDVVRAQTKDIVTAIYKYVCKLKRSIYCYHFPAIFKGQTEYVEAKIPRSPWHPNAMVSKKTLESPMGRHAFTYAYHFPALFNGFYNF